MAAIAAHHGLVFIGFMAAGKTRAAEAGAERLDLGVIDTDDLLEGELGEPIASFFLREGEIEFRRREERLIVSVLDALAGQVGGPSSVVAAYLRVARTSDPALGRTGRRRARGAVAGGDAGHSRRAHGLGRVGQRLLSGRRGEGSDRPAGRRP